MKTLRPAKERGTSNHGWLQANFTFSFADYYDPKHMGFRDLRVINEDYIKEGMGFGTHPHRDMEIVSFILEGGLQHKDTLGNEYTIRPGEIQVMSAGTGIAHSEVNPDMDQVTRSLQIWIQPNRSGHTPRYASYRYEGKTQDNQLNLIADHDGTDGVASIHADAKIYLGKYSKSSKEELKLESNRHYWVHMIKGEIHFDDQVLKESDGLGISKEELVKLDVQEDTEFLLFDLV